MSVTSQQSMDVVEDAREIEWKSVSFAGELFMGNYRPELITPYPLQSDNDKELGDIYMEEMKTYLKKNLDPDKVDATHLIPDKVMKGLAKMGAFGIKISPDYKGKGLSQTNYCRVMSMVSSYCASTAVLLSAHQSIGVPVPLKAFGTDAQKKKYLPRLAKGAVSAFALTEPGVGSDPARMSTQARLSEDGKHWILNGEKLWCTNGAIAELIIVMACTPPKIVRGKERTQISTFIVETKWEGFEVKHRSSFMGLNGIQNAVLEFKDLKVPVENLLGEEGKGLKIAFTTLNTGRLTLPAACAGVSKISLQYARLWGERREQWGQAIGKHEAMEEKLAQMSANLFAVESITWLACAMVDRGGHDIRIEAAIAKLVGSELSWDILDEALQIRGGRGYETSTSLAARGEEKWPLERMYRDNRINMIIEGSSEIMYLFLAREALDPHMKVAGALTDPRSSKAAKIKSFFKAGWFYARWYPQQWIPRWLLRSHDHAHQNLRTHSRFISRFSKKLSRSIFYAITRYQAGLEYKQMLMTRLVAIGTELYVMSTCISRATELHRRNPIDSTPIQLADLYCRGARRRVKANLKNLFFGNDDKQIKAINRKLRDGKLKWLEEGIIPAE